MKSAVPKVLHQVCGLPMIEHVLRSGDALHPTSTTVVVGHGAELVRDKLATRPSVSLVVQEPQLGTGHALLQAERPLADAAERWWCCPATFRFSDLARSSGWSTTHAAQGAAATVLTAQCGRSRPATAGSSGGRADRVDRRASRRDAPRSAAIGEINSGIYAFDLEPLFEALRSIGSAERAAGVLPAGSRPHVSRARARRRDGGSRRSRARFSASTAAASWPSSRRTAARSQERRAHGRRRHDRRSRATWIEPDVDVGPDTRAASRRLPAGANHHRRAAASSSPASVSSTARSATTCS